MSWFNSRKNKHPLETQAALDGLKAMAWPAFEALIGAAFRQRGYSVEPTGKGGLEGDVDIFLRKDGLTELVQCKQWKTQQVAVVTVRELWGLVAHHHADAVKIISAGRFATDAEQFAHGKAIDLIDGERLLELVRGVRIPQPGDNVEQAPVPAKSAATPTCPRCSAAMFKRFNPQLSQIYWGCIMYPRCKGTRTI